MAKYPDESVIEAEPALLSIHQQDCSSLSFGARGMKEDRQMLRRAFVINVVDDRQGPRWQNGALTYRVREGSNLPPPIQVGAHGGRYWSFRRETTTGDLLYTSGYVESGLFFLTPFRAHREVRCSLVKQR